MFRAIILPIFRNTRLCVTACGIMHSRCCRPATGRQHRGYSVRQYFSACYSENAIPSKTCHSCAPYDSKTCLLTTNGCHVVLCSFEWTAKLVEFFNVNLYVGISLLIAAYEAGRMWTWGVMVLAGVETWICSCYSYIGDHANCRRVMLSETKKLTAKKSCVKLHANKCDGHWYVFRLQRYNYAAAASSCCRALLLSSPVRQARGRREIPQ